MVFHWSLSERTSSQASRTLLSTLADLNTAVDWMVSTRLLFSKSFNHCTSPLVSVPSALITIGITVNFMFHSFFQFSSKVEVLIFLFDIFQFYPVVSRIIIIIMIITISYSCCCCYCSSSSFLCCHLVWLVFRTFVGTCFQVLVWFSFFV